MQDPGGDDTGLRNAPSRSPGLLPWHNQRGKGWAAAGPGNPVKGGAAPAVATRGGGDHLRNLPCEGPAPNNTLVLVGRAVRLQNAPFHELSNRPRDPAARGREPDVYLHGSRRCNAMCPPNSKNP